MPKPTPSSRVIHIGAFELDPTTGELTRQGRKVQLTVQLVQVLLTLLESPGELVTREELVRRLWPTGTFVDFDHSLNKAVNKLRDALGDSADAPTYIETLPRRGYRLIATVERDIAELGIEEPAVAPLEPVPAAPPIAAASADKADIVPAPSSPSKWRRPYLAMTVGAVCVGLLMLVLVPGWRAAIFGGVSAHTLTDRDTILVADFANKTGDAVFDEALREGLLADLSQSPFLSILAESTIRQQLHNMGRPPDTPLTPDLAREVCRRANSKVMLSGSISSLGTHYAITLKAVNCEDGNPVHVEQQEADRRERVLGKLHEAARALRTKLGESLASIERHDTLLFPDTTSSLEALEAYALALKTWRAKGGSAALPLFKRAVELDPNFAVANAALAVVYSDLGQPALSADYATKAHSLRDQLSEWERFSIDSTYFLYATGEQDKTAQVNEAWKEVYPRSLEPYINLGIVDTNLGRLEKALEVDLEGARLAPNSFRARSNLFYDYVSLDRLPEAKAILDEARARKLNDSMVADYYQMAFLENDGPAMDRALAAAAGSGDENALVFYHSDTEAFYGRLRRARELSSRAVDLAVTEGSKETVAGWYVSQAVREVEFGNSGAGKSKATNALALSSTTEVQIAAAMALARAGDVERAQALIQNLRKRLPTHTLLNSYWIPCIQAAMALRRNNAPAALEYLQIAQPYELGGGRPSQGAGATMYPAYLRGEAFLMMHQWNDAAIEFQKILGHRGLVWNFPLGALANLQLARAYAGAGDAASARKSFDNFFLLWRDADSDIPVLRQAKAEYAGLSKS